jgi:hypothetical protein
MEPGMSIHQRLADLIEDAGGGSVLTLQPQCPELTTKQLTNALQQARRDGLIHKVGHAHLPGTKCGKVALYEAGPDPVAVAPGPVRRPIASVWELAAL